MLPVKLLKKVNYLLILTFTLLSFIGIKLCYTTIYMNTELSIKARNLWERSFPLKAPRGIIYDRNLVPLVFNKPVLTVAIIPNQIKDAKKVATTLSSILGIKYDVALKKIQAHTSMVIFNKEGNKIDYDVAMKIKNANMAGVYLIQDVERTYPYNEALASLLGFVGAEGEGLAGVEHYYDKFLKGKKGTLNYLTNAKGGILGNFSSRVEAPSPGLSLKLTLDIRLQSILEKEITNAQLLYDPKEIIGIMMDPKNGQILAISNRPTYNNNNYQDYSPTIYNRFLPVFESFEPGSTFKAMTFSAGINEGLIDMDKDTYYDKGYEIVEGQRLKSWKKGGHGLQTFLQVLQNSSNPGFVEIARRLGKDKMYDYLKRFGFGKKTKIDIAGENTGIIFNYDSFGPLEVATTGFGQGISVTPIQLVTAFSSVINGGNLYRPHVGKEFLIDNIKETVFEIPDSVVGHPITESTSLLMRRALESVVSLGSGRKGFIEGYRVGAKTGTAQIAENGRYVEGKYVLSYLAAAPMNDPSVVIYLALKEPTNCIQYGGTTVGPLVRNILEEALPILGVEKNYEGIEKEYTWMDLHNYNVPNFIGKKIKELKSPYFKFEFMGEGDYVLDQLPKVGERIEEGKTIWIMKGDGYED